MKSKLVLWGTDANEGRILIAMQLRTADNKVDVWTFPEAITTPEFSQKMLNEWRNNVEIPFPDGATCIERELQLAAAILPDSITPDRPDIVTRAQTEWQFAVLSAKLHEQYKGEIAEIGDKVAQLTEYSGEVWGALKGFWGKVQSQVKEQNLFREHADELRDMTNELFTQVKEKRAVVMNEFEENSKKWHEEFSTILDDIERRIEGGIQRFPEIFDQLKSTQSRFREQRMTKDHQNELWTRLDALFKNLKERRFGNQPADDGSMVDRLTRRLEGLINAVDKMTDSIDFDKRELDFQRKKVANSEGQLEAQLRQAKINIILERVKSKEEKLAEMQKTKAEIEQKLTSARQKEAKREATAAKTEAKPAENVAVVETPVPPATPSVTEAVKAEVKAEPKIEVAVTEPVSETADITADAHAALEAVEALG